MDIVLTGTGSPLPDAGRAGPSTLIKAGDTHILVDAGRGVVMRLAGAGSLPAFLGAVLITHLHSDHICALNDVITTHWVTTQGKVSLEVYGPVGTAQFVERQLHALEADIGYRIEHHELLTNGPRVDVTELEPGDSFEVKDVRVTTAATVHAPVKPTIGYRLTHQGSVAAVVGDTIPCDGVDEIAAGAGAQVEGLDRLGQDPP
ncbi:MAG: MBL fold metallo-hydrolase, partial [Acidimicrobiales bacterium]